jgi:hypothetical protein
MLRCRKPPSQTWRTFLENHLAQLVSIDFFTVPKIRFQVLYVFLVLAHDRRRILHVGEGFARATIYSAACIGISGGCAAGRWIAPSI